MYGIPNASTRKLQRVQNSAVRLVLGVKGKHVNIDDFRRTKLHWLPVKDRIVFKILCTYKSLNDRHLPTFRTCYTDTNPLTPLAQPLNVFSNLHLKYPLILRGKRFRCLSTKAMERSTSFHQERSFSGYFQETFADSPV